MPGATPLPKRGEVFFDHRRPDRSLRLSPHPDAGVVVLSIWNGGVCQATFQLPGDQVAMFVDTLGSIAPPEPVWPTPPMPPGPPVPPGSSGPDVFRTGDHDTQPTIA
ncbi:MAG: hypothetical protein ACRDP6_38545 [Actinoallomurus sp.]